MFLIAVGLLGIAAIAGGLYFVFSYSKNIPAVIITPKPVEQKPKTLAVDDGTFCFVRNQIATEAAPYASTEHAVVTRVGSTITGTKTGIQSGPGVSNGYTGTINGTIVGNLVTVLFAYTVEGSQGSEQEEYQVTNTELIKHHYQLKDEKGILVPDKTKTERDPLEYTREPCE